MRLSGLSPFGPIFGKELRVAARRKRNYLLRVAYLGGLILFLLWAWALAGSFGYYGGRAMRAEQQQQLGYFFFAFFSMFCIGAMALIGPVLTSTAINGERQAKTLHVLLMTPLTAWQIVSGKLFSRTLTALTLIGLSLPVLALVRLLGGVEVDQMFGVLALCAVVALASAALGLFLSILLRRAFAVILLSYLWGAFFYGILPALTAALMPRSLHTALPWLTMLSGYNPFWATGLLGWGQMRMMGTHWSTCVTVHLGITAVLLTASAYLVRRQARREGEVAAPAGEAITLPTTMPAEMAANGAVSESGFSRNARTVSDSPILWRELRRPLMTRKWQRVAGSIITVGLLLLGYLAAAVNEGLRDRDFHAFIACCFYSLMMLVTCVVSATSIAQEKEGDTWTVLLASPLSGSAVIWGKTLGVLRRLMWPMALVAGNAFLFCLARTLTTADLLLSVGVTAMFNSIWIATGIALSLRFRKVTTAVIINIALPILLYGAGSLVIALIDELFDWRGSSLTDQIGWYLPYYYLVEGISAGRWRETRQLPATNGEVSVATFVMVALGIGLLHVFVAAGTLLWTSARFNRIVRRAPQNEPLAAA